LLREDSRVPHVRPLLANVGGSFFGS